MVRHRRQLAAPGQREALGAEHDQLTLQDESDSYCRVLPQRRGEGRSVAHVQRPQQPPLDREERGVQDCAEESDNAHRDEVAGTRTLQQAPGPVDVAEAGVLLAALRRHSEVRLCVAGNSLNF